MNPQHSPSAWRRAPALWRISDYSLSSLLWSLHIDLHFMKHFSLSLFRQDDTFWIAFKIWPKHTHTPSPRSPVCNVNLKSHWTVSYLPASWVRRGDENTKAFLQTSRWLMSWKQRLRIEDILPFLYPLCTTFLFAKPLQQGYWVTKMGSKPWVGLCLGPRLL